MDLAEPSAEPRRARGSRAGASAAAPAAAELARTIEALLFLSPDPLTPAELADTARADELEVPAAVGRLAEQYAPGLRGIQLRELARRLYARQRPARGGGSAAAVQPPTTATLTPAQAETLAIVAYLQPVSRPEITRIRGVSADSAAATLLERGLIEEAGRSQFGAVLYRTGTQFLKLFGLRSLRSCPTSRSGTPRPRSRQSCASGCCAPARPAPRAGRRAMGEAGGAVIWPNPSFGKRWRGGEVVREQEKPLYPLGAVGRSGSAPPAGRRPRRCRARASAAPSPHAALLQRVAEGRDRLAARALESETRSGCRGSG